MKIAVDAFGGDNAPLDVIKGAALAVEEYGAKIILTGDENIIKKVAQENNISLDNIEIVHTTDIIEVTDEPTDILNVHAQSSMAVAMKLVVDDKAQAFVSAGSTGAAVVGASLIIKRIKGIKRVAISPIIPSQSGCYILLDGGANLDVRADMLVQFAMMGSIYMNKIIGVNTPRIGLVNVGEEETKGRDLQLDTYELLKNSKLNFIGNIEARDVPLGKADVVVTDGFTGNVILKLTEGVAKQIMTLLKSVFTSSIVGKLSALLVMGEMKKLKKKMDYTEYGGAALLGASKPVIKAHGSSNAYAFKNAIRQAIEFVEKDINGEIIKALNEGKANK